MRRKGKKKCYNQFDLDVITGSGFHCVVVICQGTKLKYLLFFFFCFIISIKPRINFCLETDPAEVSEDAGSEEAEDFDFWEGVTKPGSSKTSFPTSQQENQV